MWAKNGAPPPRPVGDIVINVDDGKGGEIGESPLLCGSGCIGRVPERVGRGGGIPLLLERLVINGVRVVAEDGPAEYRLRLGEFAADAV